jgi:hypothetical protein
MSYGAMPSWPPAWTWSGGIFRGKPTGEIGVLTEIMPSPNRSNQMYLLVEHHGGEYIGCLMFKDPAACRRIFEILKAHRGYRIEHIGGLDLADLL